VEQYQRDLRKAEKEKGEMFIPQFFSKTRLGWDAKKAEIKTFMSDHMKV